MSKQSQTIEQSIVDISLTGHMLSLLNPKFDLDEFTDHLNYIKEKLGDDYSKLGHPTEYRLLHQRELYSIYEYIALVHDQTNTCISERDELLSTQLRYILSHISKKYELDFN